MNTELNVYGNIASQANNIDTTGIYYLLNIILFGSVIIFILVFAYNFLKAYMSGDETLGKKEAKKEVVKNNSVKRIVKNNVCENCGQVNELDARFCKNCGERLN